MIIHILLRIKISQLYDSFKILSKRLFESKNNVSVDDIIKHLITLIRKVRFKMSLQPLVEKLLLTEIEELNIERKAVVFKQLCDENELLFGKKGSDNRRKLQEYMSKLKRKTIRSYVQLLDHYLIRHSETTSRLLSLEGKCPSPETMNSNDQDAESMDYLEEEFKKKMSIGSSSYLSLSDPIEASSKSSSPMSLNKEDKARSPVKLTASIEIPPRQPSQNNFSSPFF